ncbi:MAG: ferrous iron transport protein B [Clostridia bacterium]|nr:ferrous iron transport protein B [Clostridia bacterium]
MALKIALAGNPNSGKTTLFNALTGSNQFVGNWPGVTVEKKEGKLKSDNDVILTDLPGIYSLSPYTLEEVVSRNYLINERPDAILNIVDGTNLERNLYLTTQLMELGIPVVVAINMMDVVRKRGDKIDIVELSFQLGCDIVEISALKLEGIEEAANKAIAAAKQGAQEPNHIFSGEIEHVIAHIEEAAVHQLPDEQQRWYAIKIFERDTRVHKYLNMSKELIDHVEGDIVHIEKRFDDDAESIITNERYDYIEKIVKRCCQKPSLGRLTISDKIDKIVTNRILALPIFALVMFIVYYVSVTTVGTWATDWANDGVFGDGWEVFGFFVPGIPALVGNALSALNVAPWLESLILDGIIGGVGAVLGFVPQMLVLFIFLAFLEGCGYMARIAFIMDRLFRRFGLSGKSFIPMLIGTGCGVPGIMASRTIENDRDRKMTIITTTFIPCSAKLPIIALIAGAMFNGAPWVAPSAYFAGVAAIVISGVILKKSKLFAGDTAPFVMELPAYHMPTFTNVMRSMWERGWSFIKKAGTVILLSTIVLWFLNGFGVENGSFGMIEDINNSILAMIGSAFAWVFIPLGFGDWQATVATVTGLIAKENVVATFGVIFGHAEVSEAGQEIWTALQMQYSQVAMYAFLIFNLLCAPCFAAIGAIKREMNNIKWTFFAIGYQTVFAYLVALCVYQIGTFFVSGMFTIGTAVAIAVMLVFLYFMFRRVKK